ncbi:hypothetical protein CPB86DRAFT_325801 [Serendipita vermifera]|nr:hypothetical protein CPB86DRAFT_325801 [Serendipita vermifera]
MTARVGPLSILGCLAHPDPLCLTPIDAEFQYIRLPSRHALPIIPIYDTPVQSPPSTYVAPVPMPDVDYLGSSNLYPEPSMPLTVRQTDYPQHYPQQQRLGVGSEEDPWIAVMENVSRLEQSNPISQPANPIHSALTLNSVPQSRPVPNQRPQPQMMNPQTPRLPPPAPPTRSSSIIVSTQLQPPRLSQSVALPPPPQPHYDYSPPGVPDELTQIVEAATFDMVMEDRLNTGAKEIHDLPSALPAIPSLAVRTPAPRQGHSHPYSSPRMAPLTSPRLLSLGSLANGGGSARSIRPFLSRGPGSLALKRDSISSTTAYLAGLRRPVPLSSSAFERTPDEPYPRTYGPHTLSMTYALGNGVGTMPGSATGMDMSNRRSSSLGAESSSTGTMDLPPESPYSATSVGFGSQSSPAAIKRESVPPVPPSPNWVNGQTYSTSPNSLRLERVNSNANNGGGATAGANSAKDLSPPPTASTTKSTESEDRLLPQTRATASRKRADDDLISHSFRTEAEWRRRAVLDNILNAVFLLENLMEPNNAGPNDPLTMGLGPVGKSVYAVFLEQVDRSQWKCLFGDKEHPCGSQATSFKRLERALDHVRSHLNHRPFQCEGDCPKGETCDARFFAKSHLQDHVKRTESARCETCGQVIRIQNMPRHRLAH